jgi:hypothetical protein
MTPTGRHLRLKQPFRLPKAPPRLFRDPSRLAGKPQRTLHIGKRLADLPGTGYIAPQVVDALPTATAPAQFVIRSPPMSVSAAKFSYHEPLT